MFPRRAHTWLLMLVCLLICSTAIADVDASAPEARAVKAKAVSKKPPAAKTATKAPAKPVVKAPAPVKPVAKAPVKPVAKAPTPIKKPVTVKPVTKVPTKPTVKPAVKPIAKVPVKASTKVPVKPVVKPPTKSAVKSASAAAPAASGALVCVKPTRRTEIRAVGGKVPDQFIVHLKPGVNRAKHLATLKTLIAQGAKCDRTKSAITLDGALPEKLSLYGGKFGPSVIAALKKSPDVKSVVEDTLLQVDSPIPVTPAANVTKRAFLFDITQTNSWSLARLNTKARTVTDAISQEDFTTPDGRNRNTRNWPFKNIRNAGKDVNVYIIDTGVSDHSDLTGRITRRPRANVVVAADDPNANDTNDGQGHGTKMAGIIAGQTCGVAKFATIIPVKASEGNTGTITQLGIMAGLAFAANDAKAKGGVINISVTMRKDQDDGLPEMISSVIAAGMHIVNSAGNSARDDCAVRIGTTDGPITVGNVGIDDAKAFSSNFGPCLTVFAPGNDIQTTAHNNPTGFISGSGTSEATAHTSGLVATLLSDSKLSPAAMKKKVVSLSVQVPTIIAAGTTNRLIQVPS